MPGPLKNTSECSKITALESWKKIVCRIRVHLHVEKVWNSPKSLRRLTHEQVSAVELSIVVNAETFSWSHLPENSIFWSPQGTTQTPKQVTARYKGLVEIMHRFPSANSASKVSTRSIYCAHFSMLRDSQKHTTRLLGVHISFNLRCLGATQHATRDRLLDELGIASSDSYPTTVQKGLSWVHNQAREALLAKATNQMATPSSCQRSRTQFNVCTCFFVNSWQRSVKLLNQTLVIVRIRQEPAVD